VRACATCTYSLATIVDVVVVVVVVVVINDPPSLAFWSLLPYCTSLCPSLLCHKKVPADQRGPALAGRGLQQHLRPGLRVPSARRQAQREQPPAVARLR
jgi:hypothetical protein